MCYTGYAKDGAIFYHPLDSGTIAGKEQNEVHEDCFVYQTLVPCKKSEG